MRKIQNIVLHCTATPQNTTVESIQRYWEEQLKWKSPGYHKIIKADGSVITLANDEQICNGVAGHNAASVHISYIGGQGGVDTRTPAQTQALQTLVLEYLAKYPGARVLGHRDFPGVKKDCPSFDVKKWLKTWNQHA
jgi:N-acetylmuramoyl-L-alanine amidase